MEEARAVLARLERIEALDRENVEPKLVLAELRELVREVEAWTRCERAGLVEDHVIVEV
jgi:Asp-tRNA(Asn)/Glu-tRNA(Gln) amidotransferase C subunit